jgi:desulfoferrodoxin (superoxide reductase-like protein)
MKILLLCLALIFIFTPSVFSNPPRSIDIKTSAEKIEVFVSHPSQSPSEHYIKTITVALNDREIIQQTFSLQKTDGQTAVYEIAGLKKGDKITVRAYCSMYGDLQKEITVE